MFRRFVQKLLGSEFSVSPLARKIFAQPVQTGFYLSELVVEEGRSADVCVVNALINQKLDAYHVYHHRLCVGNFSRNMVEAVNGISDDQTVAARKDDLLEYIVVTTGLLPILPPAANPGGSLVAKLNRTQIERLKGLVPNEPQPSGGPQHQTNAPPLS